MSFRLIVIILSTIFSQTALAKSPHSCVVTNSVDIYKHQLQQFPANDFQFKVEAGYVSFGSGGHFDGIRDRITTFVDAEHWYLRGASSTTSYYNGIFHHAQVGYMSVHIITAKCEKGK